MNHDNTVSTYFLSSIFDGVSITIAVEFAVALTNISFIPSNRRRKYSISIKSGLLLKSPRRICITFSYIFDGSNSISSIIYFVKNMSLSVLTQLTFLCFSTNSKI